MSSSQLKVLAMLTMLIDHVGAVFYPELLFLRVIGRVTFPIFAFLIAEGYSKTSNVNKYIIRLGLFALISEIPFDLVFFGKVFYGGYQNIFLTLVLALIAINLYDKLKRDNKIFGLILVLVMGIIALLLKTDYGLFGVFIIFGFYLFRGNFTKQVISFSVLNLLLSARLSLEMFAELRLIFNGLLSAGLSLQMLAVLGLIFIGLYNEKKGANLKYLFYVFYPGHLLILFLLNN